MAKAVLKQTSNTNFQRLIGIEGELSVGSDNRFHFHFLDSDGKVKDLSSGVVDMLGDLENPVHKDVCINTKNSTYYFEKSERVKESLFSHLKNKSLDENIMTAEEKLEVKKAMDSVYGSILKNNKPGYSR